MTGSHNENILLSIYQDKRSVFLLKDIAMLTGQADRLALGKKLNYYVKKGKLLNPRKGIYARPGFTPEELACRLYTPSYISLEYVLQRAGVIFQYDDAVTSISYLSRRTEIDKQDYVYHKIKEATLTNLKGIIRKPNGVNIATPERALLDKLYLNPQDYIDNLNIIDKEKALALLDIYNNTSLEKNLKRRLRDGRNQ
jgi:hypothetical protein